MRRRMLGRCIQVQPVANIDLSRPGTLRYEPPTAHLSSRNMIRRSAMSIVHRKCVILCATITGETRMGGQIQGQRHARWKAMRQLKRGGMGRRRRVRIQTKTEMRQGLIPLIKIRDRGHSRHLVQKTRRGGRCG